jgi:cytosolic nonspecific dipeptidase
LYRRIPLEFYEFVMEKVLNDTFAYIDNHHEDFVERLRKVVAIPSVSTWSHCREHTILMMQHYADLLKGLDADTELCDIGEQTVYDGSQIRLPPILLAQLGNDSSKKTLLIYGHLDVQPADIKDGWDSEPFQLVERNGNMYGRGSSDDKGPCLGWINAIEALKVSGHELPINLKFCLEGMEESGSQGLNEFVISKKDTFFKDVDYVVISDNYWLGKTKPCLTYGLRGNCAYFLEVTGAKQDLHSGIYGGAVPEAMIDCVHLLSSLVDRNGRIQVPGVYDQVRPLTEEENKLYESIDFDIEDFRNDVGCESLLHSDKTNLLQHRWRHPSLSIHGIEGAFSEPGCKTVIPRKVIGKFSIRVVPDQVPDDIDRLVVDYLTERHKESGSPNIVKVIPSHNSVAWLANDIFNCPSYAAARRAIQRVWNVEPDMTREGCTIPVTLLFQEVVGKSVLLLPMGQCDDGAHSQNEKLSKKNYIEGTKVMVAYFYELGH